MNKKLIIGLSIFFILILVTTHNADARLLFEPFEAIYMTDSYGSTTEKTIFDWDEIPWLYLRLPRRGPNVTLALWKNPKNNRYLTGSIGHNQEVWLTLGDHWYDVRKLGEWEIKAGYIKPFPKPHIGSGSTSFTVTPEPISSILFLSGGAILAIRLYYKKRNKRN